MRPFRSARLLIPVLVIPVVLATVVLPTQAWAHGPSKVSVKCYTLTGTWGVGNWTLTCNQEQVTGSMGTVAANFPSSTATVIWGNGPNRLIPPDQTTFSMATSQRMGRFDKCPSGSSEFVVSGGVISNTQTPAVKGKVKAFVCVNGGGALSLLKAKNGFSKPFKI